MMKQHIFLLAVLLSSAMHALADRAIADHASTEQVEARLIAATDAVYPGETIWLGVQQKIIPHWHTYWINPGDSGLPTKIAWKLPDGASAGEIHWPAPTRFDLDGITNYGYSDEVVLLTPITLPRDLSIGKSIAIDAKVEWLVCADVCIPQSVDLALTLPVVAAGEKRNGNALIDSVRAALPQTLPWSVQTENSNGALKLRIKDAAAASADWRDVQFFADTWGHVQHPAQQITRRDGADVVIELTAGDKKLTAGEALAGIAKITTKAGAVQAYIVGTPNYLAGSSSLPDKSVAGVVANQAARDTEKLGVLSAVVFALLGGLVLNLMPCVFPVLSIKALSLVKHSANTPLQNRLHGLTYTGGVLASFLLLALLLIGLKAGGAQFGWGFQYQSPLFVLMVAYLLFAVGLNLSGVFEFGTSIAGTGSNLASKSGYAGSFFTGVLAAIVATPCTAPFMGAAIGFALSQPALPLIAIFLSLGLGLALPYLLLTFWPHLQKRLPKPGRWMETLKQALAFPMYAAAVWLIWVLAQQTSADAIAFALGGIVLIAFAAWLYQHSRVALSLGRSLGTVTAIVALIVAVAGGYIGTSTATPASAVASSSAHTGNAIPYSPQRLQELRGEGKAVFVNFTAAWCISCLVNERVALKQDAVVSAFAQQNIVYLKGDWTNRDSEISAKLSEFGRSGVPLYLYFPPHANSEPIVLPQILTPDIVLSSIESANATRGTATKAVTTTQQP